MATPKQQQPVERVYHIQAVSTRGPEHDDEDAWVYLQEKREEIASLGCWVNFSRSFGSRAHNGVNTTVVLGIPVSADPKRAMPTPQQFFANTDLVEFSINEIVAAEQQTPEAAQASQPGDPINYNVAG
jgi:hypothetical protein